MIPFQMPRPFTYRILDNKSMVCKFLIFWLGLIWSIFPQPNQIIGCNFPKTRTFLGVEHYAPKKDKMKAPLPFFNNHSTSSCIKLKALLSEIL